VKVPWRIHFSSTWLQTQGYRVDTKAQLTKGTDGGLDHTAQKPMLRVPQLYISVTGECELL